MEFLSSSIAQLKVVQTKYVEAKDCLNVLNKSNEGEWDPEGPISSLLALPALCLAQNHLGHRGSDLCPWGLPLPCCSHVSACSPTGKDLLVPLTSSVSFADPTPLTPRGPLGLSVPSFNAVDPA